MKKVLTLTGIATMLLLGACEKENKNDGMGRPSPNRVVVIPSDGKAASTTILVSHIGHNGKNCGGCVLDGGEFI